MKIGTTMMDPKNILFESDMDVIDYVSGGILPPGKRKFDLLMAAIENPTPDNPINVDVDAIDDPDLLVRYAKQVYNNRLKNTAIVCGALGIVGLGLGISTIRKGRRHKDEDCRDCR